MMIRLTRKLDDAPADAPPSTLTLDFDARNKSRQRVELDNGEDAGLMLARGTVLQAGDWLADDDNRHCVQIRAADETLSMICCDDRLLLNRLCYHLGNRHVPLQVMADRIYYRRDHVLDAMVAGLGGEPAAIRAPFRPEPGAYDRVHSHSHEHSHG